MNGVYRAIYGTVSNQVAVTALTFPFVTPGAPFVIGEPPFVRSGVTAAASSHRRRTPSPVSHARVEHVRRVAGPARP